MSDSHVQDNMRNGPTHPQIGGWLILPAVGLALAPVVSVVNMIWSLANLFGAEDAQSAGLLAVDVVISLGLLTFQLYAGSRFYSRKKDAPVAVITLFLATVAASGLLVLISLAVGNPDFARANGAGLVRAAIGSAIWIPYFRVSKRVKSTFINEEYDSQRDRWFKYGANVASACVVVVILAAAITYLAERNSRRIDTTSAGLFSLKPQTVNLIKGLEQKIKLVSLYSAKDAAQKDNPYAGPVRDLLEEYSRKGKNIEFDVIDPITQPTKADALLAEAVEKYGGAVEAYKQFIASFQSTHAQLTELLSAEAAAVAGVRTDALPDSEQSQQMALVIETVRDGLPQSVANLKERVDRAQRAKFPDYKAIIDRVRNSLDGVSQAEAAIIKFGQQRADDQTVPQPIREYLTASASRHEAIKKLADDVMKTIDSLGELKVGQLQQAIKSEDLILVLGEKDWRVLSKEQVWITDTRDLRSYTEGQELRPRFAGEQAITTAVLSLTSNTKPKVAFVRSGGPPLTTPGFLPFQRGGPLSELAERLRGYNFETLEKDLSGMWEMQSRMQGAPAEPEPSDEQIKDAVWIVINAPSSQRFGQSPSIAPKVSEHLKNGGSAMVFSLPNAEDFSAALKDYGVELRNDAVIVHEVAATERPRTNDLAEEAQWLPFVFVLNNYGEHLLTQPLKSLDMILVGSAVVRTTPTPGVTITPLLPIPTATKTWGETNLETVEEPTVSFDQVADVAGPLFAAAAAEKDGSRLVVFGALQSFTDQILSIPDPEMLRRRIMVARFPGNGELFTNAVFWLAKMEPMIAISPAAMEVSRIAPMSDATQGFWRVGVLLIALPGAVLAAGIAMYFARRD